MLPVDMQVCTRRVATPDVACPPKASNRALRASVDNLPTNKIHVSATRIEFHLHDLRPACTKSLIVLRVPSIVKLYHKLLVHMECWLV
jgi:hypothetical protein